MTTNNHVTYDLWDAVETSLGFNDTNMRRDRPPNGADYTFTGVRGLTEIKGVTFRDLRDAFIRATAMSSFQQNPSLYEESLRGEDAKICSNDIYTLDFSQLDPMTMLQNLACEIEELMGIYPNIVN